MAATLSTSDRRVAPHSRRMTALGLGFRSWARIVAASASSSVRAEGSSKGRRSSTTVSRVSETSTPETATWTVWAASRTSCCTTTPGERVITMEFPAAGAEG